MLLAGAGSHLAEILRLLRQDNVLLRAAERIGLPLVPGGLASELFLISQQPRIGLLLG